MRGCQRTSYRVGLVLGSLLLGLTVAAAQPTPPVQPQIEELPLPPPVELPGPETIPADVPQRPLSAEEAAAIALHHQPAVTAADAGLSAAQARLQQAQAGLRPSVSVAGSMADVESDAVGGGGAAPGAGPEGFQVSATLRQLIYDFNHTRDLVRQASARERSANAVLTTVQSNLVFQVKLAFYGYLENTRIVHVNETTVRNTQNHLALAQARLNAGFGLPLDVVQAETAYAQAVYALTVARNNASVARVNLAELMGIDPRTPIEPAEGGEPPPATDDMNWLLEQGLAQRPEMAQATADVDAAAYAESAARTGNSPQFIGSLGVQRRGEDFPPNDNSMSIGVAVQWTPFDAGLTGGRIKEAKANLDVAKAALASVRLTVISDISQAYVNLKSAEQAVTAAQAQVRNAQEAVRLAEGRYRSGLGVFLDVLDAQAALDTASTNQVNAEVALDQARAALSHAVGEGAVAPPEVPGQP